MPDNDPIRPIQPTDIEAVLALMVASFPRRDTEYFRQGLTRMAARVVPAGTETYGYVIDENGIKGAVLAISSRHDYAAASQVYVNISTWCVAPSHRGPLAKALYDRAGGSPDMVTTNLSAAKHTLRTLDNLGFRPVSSGQFVALASAAGRKDARMVSLSEASRLGLATCEGKTLDDHAARGCLAGALVAEDRLLPLIFLQRRIKSVLTGGQLIYCADQALLLRHAGAVLPWLRRQGKIALILDASAAIPGLYGRFLAGKAAKYLRGAAPVMAVDHTYSEMYYLGF